MARFGELEGFDGDLPECRRTLSNVIGFQPSSDQGTVSPVSAQAAKNAAIEISEAFNLGFARGEPGCGPLLHNHDTNETFIPITGRWRRSWYEEETESVEFGPLDVVSFPPGVARRLENVAFDEPGTEHLLLFVIAGNVPQAESSPKASDYMRSLEPNAI